jgi:hypothetical protein
VEVHPKAFLGRSRFIFLFKGKGRSLFMKKGGQGIANNSTSITVLSVMSKFNQSVSLC